MDNARNSSLGFKMIDLTQGEDTIRTAHQKWPLQLRNPELSEHRAPSSRLSLQGKDRLAGNELMLPLPLVQLSRGQKILLRDC